MSILSENPNFLNQLSKDLQWICDCPSLIKQDDTFIELTPLENPESLIHANQQLACSLFSSNRSSVGSYFENLVLLWFKLQPDYSNVRDHIKVFEHKRTLGEMDFLVFNQQEQITLHLEVAIKFYLLTEKQRRLQFIGPNSKDTLENKLNKLIHKQIPLSSNPLAQTALHSMPGPVLAKGLVSGILFYPSDSDWRNPPQIHASVARQHLKGWWTSSHKLLIPRASNDSHWLILRKPYWLALPVFNENLVLNHEQLLQTLTSHFTNSPKPVFLAELVQQDKQWLEQSRGFVVNQDWPD